MPIASKRECVDDPRQQLAKRMLIEGLHIASKPERVDSPRQQRTADSKSLGVLIAGLLIANPSLLMAYKKEIEGMHIASKLDCVDDQSQQFTTRRRLRECLLPANPSGLMAHANN